VVPNHLDLRVSGFEARTGFPAKGLGFLRFISEGLRASVRGFKHKPNSLSIIFISQFDEFRM
jgi:hypothetical protein